MRMNETRRCTRPRGWSRRRMLHSMAAIAAVAPMINPGRVIAADGTQYSTHAVDLVRESLVIDMLAPLTLDGTEGQRWLGSPQGMPPEELAKFKASGIDVFHHSPGIGGPNAFEEALTFIAGYNSLIARMSDQFMRIDRAADIARAKASGRIGVVLGVQNAEHFRCVDDVQLFHALGLRCAQLTYNSQNLLGGGSTDRASGGISDYGSQIIQRMNQIGMLIDVSHCNDRTTLDAIELSAAPIAITHSNCRALNDHPRLKTDEAIRKLAKRGGVMGITGVRMFVRDREPTSIEHMVEHIEHVARLVGIEHVGIGSDSDLDGYDDLPAELMQRMRAAYKTSYRIRDKGDTDRFDHPRKTYDLAEALIRRGYDDRAITAVLGGNFQRLLTEVWKA